MCLMIDNLKEENFWLDSFFGTLSLAIIWPIFFFPPLHCLEMKLYICGSFLSRRHKGVVWQFIFFVFNCVNIGKSNLFWFLTRRKNKTFQFFWIKWDMKINIFDEEKSFAFKLQWCGQLPDSFLSLCSILQEVPGPSCFESFSALKTGRNEYLAWASPGALVEATWDDWCANTFNSKALWVEKTLLFHPEVLLEGKWFI